MNTRARVRQATILSALVVAVWLALPMFTWVPVLSFGAEGSDGCSVYAGVPSGSITGFGSTSCSSPAKWRTAGAQLKEDVAYQPDPVLKDQYYVATATYFSNSPYRSAWWDNDGNTQGYFSKSYVAHPYTADPPYHQTDSGRWWTHYEWR